MSDETSGYGERLKAARLAAGLTQRALAARCGVDFTGVSHIEHGRFLPSVAVAAKFAEATGANLRLDNDAVLARSKAAQYDELRRMVGDGQALVWWVPQNNTFAVRVLQHDERIMRYPTELVRQVMNLEERAQESKRSPCYSSDGDRLG